MELENSFRNNIYDYDLFSTLNAPLKENDLNNPINLDVMRKHYYQDILAAACLIYFFSNVI